MDHVESSNHNLSHVGGVVGKRDSTQKRMYNNKKGVRDKKEEEKQRAGLVDKMNSLVGWRVKQIRIGGDGE